MAFKTYVPRRGPRGGNATIRILKNGTISVSPAAHQEWFGGAEYVELLYDPKTSKIALKPRRKPTKATYKLRLSPQGGDRRYVSASQFLEHLGIRVDKSRTVDAKWNARQGVVELSASA